MLRPDPGSEPAAEPAESAPEPAEPVAPAGGVGAGSEIRALTGLRLFAAAWVLLFHFHVTQGAVVGAVLAPLAPVLDTGALGVDLFFVLSGFVIGLTYLDRLGSRPGLRPTARFLWARLSRIWPVYAVVTTLFGGGVLLVGVLTGAGSAAAFEAVQPEVSLSSWLQQMSMVQMWTRPSLAGSSWVSPAWSLSAEWLVYLLFPLTALAFARAARLPRWALAGLAVGMVAPMAWVSLRTGSPYYSFSWLVRVLGGFASGVLAYLVVRRIPLTAQVRRWATWVAWAAVVAVLAGLWLGERMGPGEQRGGAVIVLFPVLIAALALSDRGPSRLLSSRWAVHGGRISYSLYIVHMAVFEVFWTAMQRFDVLAPDTTLATVVSPLVPVVAVLAAHLLWRYVEEPGRRRMRRLDPAASRLAGHSRPTLRGCSVASDASPASGTVRERPFRRATGVSVRMGS